MVDDQQHQRPEDIIVVQKAPSSPYMAHLQADLPCCCCLTMLLVLGSICSC